MIDVVPIHQKIVGDDSAVASPPDSLRAHQCQALVSAKIDQSPEGGGEFVTHRVIGIVVEALNAPKCIEARIDFGLLCPASAKRRPVLIADLNLFQFAGESLDIECGIGPRPRKCPNVDQHGDLSIAEHLDQFVERAIGVSNGQQGCHPIATISTDWWFLLPLRGYDFEVVSMPQKGIAVLIVMYRAVIGA